jgi:uncharacterized membrane protein YhhN
MIVALSLGAAISAGLAIAASGGVTPRWYFYLLKPLTTALIIGLAWVTRADSQTYQCAVLVALGLSWVGDVCLMFDGRRWLLAGMISFLFAHLAFIYAFTLDAETIKVFWWCREVPKLALTGWSCAALAWGVVLQGILWRRTGSLRVPVLIYGLVLLLMFVAAASRHATIGGHAPLLAFFGAALFLASDSLLSLQQFVRSYPGASILVLSTYWSAIWLIALSVGRWG